MCSRIALLTSSERLCRLFDAVDGDEDGDVDGPAHHDLFRWNVGPTAPVFGISFDHRGPPPVPGGAGQRLLRRYRWGLIPPHSASASSGPRLHNARAETVATKPSFRQAFRARRLVVPVDGFYEWRTLPTGRRRPHYITRVDGEPLALAGLWEERHDPAGDTLSGVVRSSAVITTMASPDVDEVHDRMPVVLDRESVDLWLDPSATRHELEALLRPAPVGTLTHHAVSDAVGNIGNDGPELLAPGSDDGAGDRPGLLVVPTLFD